MRSRDGEGACDISWLYRSQDPVLTIMPHGKEIRKGDSGVMMSVHSHQRSISLHGSQSRTGLSGPGGKTADKYAIRGLSQK